MHPLFKRNPYLKKLHRCLFPSLKVHGWRGALMFSLGTRQRRVVRFTFRPLHLQRTNPRCPLNRTMGGLLRRSGGFAEGERPLALAAIRTPYRPFRNLVTIPKPNQRQTASRLKTIPNLSQIYHDTTLPPCTGPTPSIASSTSEPLGSDTSGSAVCISGCPTSLIHSRSYGWSTPLCLYKLYLA